MWYRRSRRFGRSQGSSSPPFAFHFQTRFGFPRRPEYLRWLEEYKQELEQELKGVEEEIQELRGEGTA